MGSDLAAQLARFERLLDEQRHLVQIEGFVDVVIGTELHRLDCVLHGREGRHQDDERLGRGLLDSTEHGQTVAIGQPEVEQHEVESWPHLLEGFSDGTRLENAVAFLGKALPQGPAEQRLVVDDEQRCGHDGKYS